MAGVSIRIQNELDAIGALADRVDAFGRANGVPQAVLHDINVALDEIVSNVIRYGYADDAVHEIEVRLQADAGAFIAEVIDDGRPFDPTVPAGSVRRDGVATRPVGGLGLHFVRALTDNLAYVRDGTFNRVRFEKRLPGSAAGECGAVMELVESHAEDVTVLVVSGRIDSSTADAFRDRLRAITDGGSRKLLVDLGEVAYMSSAGFWALLAASRELEGRKGVLALCALSDGIADLFRLGGFSELFRILPSRWDALAALRDV